MEDSYKEPPVQLRGGLKASDTERKKTISKKKPIPELVEKKFEGEMVLRF